MANIYDASAYPIGTLAVKPFYNNVSNLDDLMLGAAPSYPDRKGVQRISWSGIEKSVFDAISGIGWNSSYIQYAAGAIVTAANQLVQYPAGNGDLYRVKNQTALPLTLTGTWATDAPKLVSVGDASVRQYVQPFIQAGFYQPQDLDVTGASDQSAKVLGYLNTYKRVRLPAGVIRIDSMTVPSNCSLVGAGNSLLDRSSKLWGAGATTIVGTVNLTGSVGCVVWDLNIDAFASGSNALAGVNAATRDHWIRRVNTRANNHNQLWEQNGSDPAGASGGNILVEDCKAYGGPNGFVTKTRGVTFRKCLAYDTTIQAFVVVSDNINGPNVYSRATNTRIENCGGDGNHQGVTIYSRDVFSETNANGVAGTQDTYVDVSFTNIGNCSVHVGFYTGGTAGFTRLYNDNVVITGGNYSAPTPVFHIRFDDAARPRVMGGYFLGANAIVYGDFCVDPVVSPNVQTYLTNTGVLAAQAIAPLNTAAVNVDIAATRMVFKNTATTAVVAATLVSSAAKRELDVVIEDSFTSITIGSSIIKGLGTCAKLGFDSQSAANSGWRIISTSSMLPLGRIAVTYASPLTFTWPSASCSVTMGGGISNFAPNGTALYVGAKVSMTFANPTGGTLAISAYTAVSWGTIAPITSIAAGKTLLLQMEWDGASHIVTSANVY